MRTVVQLLAGAVEVVVEPQEGFKIHHDIARIDDRHE